MERSSRNSQPSPRYRKFQAIFAQADGPHRRDVTQILCKVSCFLLKSFHFLRLQKRYVFSPYKSLYFESVTTMPMFADAHIQSLGYLQLYLKEMQSQTACSPPFLLKSVQFLSQPARPQTTTFSGLRPRLSRLACLGFSCSNFAKKNKRLLAVQCGIGGSCFSQLTHLSDYFKTESTRELRNFNFLWTKTLYQNNLKHIAFFFKSV